MRNAPLLLLYSIAVIVTGLSAEPSRFRRVLQLYSQYEYRADDRQTSITAAYQQQWPDVTVIDSTLDTVSLFRKTIRADAVYTRQSLQADAHGERERRIEASLALAQINGGSALAGYIRRSPDSYSTVQAFDEKDTAIAAIRLAGQYHRGFREYFTPPQRRLGPYVALALSGRGGVAFDKEENIEPPFPDSLMPSGKYIDRTLALNATADIVPAVGLGRTHNVAYVYFAFEMERALLKVGALRFALSDVNLARLADYLARNHSFRLRNQERFALFKAGLDSLIADDEAAEPKNFRYLSPFEVREVMLHSLPVFETRPRVELYAAQRFTGVGNFAFLHYPHNVFVSREDSSFVNSALTHDARLGLRLAWGLPLSGRWFLALAADKPLLSRRDGVLVQTDERLDWRKALDVRWSLELTQWQARFSFVTLFTRIVLEDLPSRIILPSAWPYRFSIQENLFFEDYFSLQLDVSLFQSRGVDRSAVAWSRPFERPLHGFVPGLRMSYRF